MNTNLALPFEFAASASQAKRLRRTTGLAALLCLAASISAPEADAQSISVAPSTRTEQMQSAPAGLPDQQTQRLNLRTPLTTSLVTVANLGGSGHRSFLVTLHLAHGGSISLSAREGGQDIALALSQPIPVTALSVRCDSFTTVNCRYAISLVGN